jgi:hypothetical protein
MDPIDVRALAAVGFAVQPDGGAAAITHVRRSRPGDIFGALDAKASSLHGILRSLVVRRPGQYGRAAAVYLTM